MMKYLVYIFCSCILLFSCNEEDFLTEEPHSDNDVSFYTSEIGALQGLNAAYDILQLGEEVERVEFIGTICSGDAMAGGEPGGGDQPPMQAAMRFETGSDSPYMLNYWSAMYRGVYRANLLINYLSESIDGFDENLREQILGEAYFLRGLYHFKLQTLFGGYPQLQGDFNNQLKGVPYVDVLLTSDIWNDVERPALDVTWTGIENDFQQATNLLSARSELAPTEYGRATRGAAQAMLAKTHLYQNEFEEAYTNAAAVINSDEYALMGESTNPGPFTITRTSKEGEVSVDVSGYKYIYQPEANNCAEDIFSVQHYDEHSNNYPQRQEGNLIPQYYGLRRVMTYDNSDENLVSTEYFWGFILPTTYFVETAYEDIGCEVAGEIVDPRYKIAVVSETDSVPYYYDDEVLRAKYPDSALFDPWGNWPSTGYGTMKYFTDPYYNINSQTLGDHPQNTKYLRFADVLLIGAEAAAETGRAADAVAWVNRVRERARNAGTTGYPQPYTSVTVEQILAERRVELAFEGHQFFDVVRTGRANQVIKTAAMQYEISTNPQTGTTAPQQFGSNFLVGKNEIFPIPLIELELMTSPTFTQNPGYN